MFEELAFFGQIKRGNLKNASNSQKDINREPDRPISPRNIEQVT